MSSSAASPARGEVWGVDFNPTVGREQAGVRPALVVSADGLNDSPRGLVIVLPITSTNRGLPTHVAIDPPEGGVIMPCVAMAEQVRAVSKHRLGRCYGEVMPETMDQVDEALRVVLGL